MGLWRLSFVSTLALAACASGNAFAQSQTGDIYSAFEEAEEPAPSKSARPVQKGETVAQAILAALTHDPQLEIAQAQMESARAERLRALGQFLPEIEASATYTDDDFRSQTLQTLEDRDGTTVGVTASQPIFQGFSAINRLRESGARLSESDFAFLASRQQVALEAAQAHAGVVLARAVVDHRVENLTLVNRQLEVTDRRMRAGAQSRTGVEQARMRSAQAQVDLAQARAVLAQREAAYARIVGHAPPPTLAQNAENAPVDFTNLDAAQTSAFANNPALNGARAALKAAKFAKSAARGDFAPKLSIEGSYFRRYGEDNILSTEDEEYQVVARVRKPIFSQARNIAGVKSAGAAIAEQTGRLNDAELSVEETVARSWRQLIEAGVRRSAAERGIDAAALSVQGLQIEYEAGRRTVIDVLDGQRDLVVARINQSQAEHDLALSQYELAAATGLMLAFVSDSPEQQN